MKEVAICVDLASRFICKSFKKSSNQLHARVHVKSFWSGITNQKNRGDKCHPTFKFFDVASFQVFKRKKDFESEKECEGLYDPLFVFRSTECLQGGEDS